MGSTGGRIVPYGPGEVGIATAGPPPPLLVVLPQLLLPLSTMSPGPSLLLMPPPPPTKCRTVPLPVPLLALPP